MVGWTHRDVLRYHSSISLILFYAAVVPGPCICNRFKNFPTSARSKEAGEQASVMVLGEALVLLEGDIRRQLPPAKGLYLDFTVKGVSACKTITPLLTHKAFVRLFSVCLLIPL